MKLIKWLLWLVLFVSVVAIGGAIFLVNKVDPNDFKPQIAQQVDEQIGRQLDIKGDLAWRFYPWVGVTMNDFTLSNREGFTPANMLEAAQVDVQVKLIPLISRRIEIGKIKFDSPIINLAQKANGESNWGDMLAADSSAVQSPTESGEAAGAMLGGLVIQGIDISNGSIDWNDELGGQHVQLSQFNLNTGSVKPGEPITFDLNSQLEATALPDKANISLGGEVWVNESFEEIKLNGLRGDIAMADLAADADIDAIRFSVPRGELGMDSIKAKVSRDDLAANVDINSLSFALNSGQLQAGTLKGSLEMGQINADVVLNTINYAVESGQLALETAEGEVSMDQMASKMKADQIGYSLNSGMAKIKSLNYDGNYQALPFNGASTDVVFDVNASHLSVAAQNLSSEFNGLPINLKAEKLQLDLTKETLQIPHYAANVGDAAISGNVAIDHLMSDLAASGHLKTNQFDPRAMLEKLGIDALAEMPAQALRAVELETAFNGGMSDFAVDKLNAKIDESSIKGHFSMKNFAQPVYRFGLDLDAINVDHYLSEEKQAVAQEAGPGAAAVLPFAALKGLDVKGKLSVGELNFIDLISKDVVVNIDTSQDRIEIAPLSARAYGGQTSNKVVYDISGDVPGIEIESTLTTLDIGPFLQALKISDRLEGVGNVNSTLRASGVDVDEMIANLNGDINIDLNDGAIRGADIQKSMIEVAGLYKQLKGKDHGLSTEVGDKTKFSNFSTQIKVDQGILSTDSVDLRAPGLRITGGGKVDLNKDELDLKLLVSVVETLEGQGGQAVDELKGETIPLKITGTLDSPKLLPDLSAIARRQLERKLSEKYLGGKKISGDAFKDKAKDKLNRKLAEKLGLKLPKASAQREAATVQERQASPSEEAETSEAVNSQIESADEAQSEAEVEPEPEDPEEAFKRRLKEEKKKLKGKLMDKLFGG